jgi:hypothetical protein
MELEFSFRGFTGKIRVSCPPNLDESALGSDLLSHLPPDLGPEVFDGLPSCTATVEYDTGGYAAVFGWTQLVRSSDNQTGGQAFESDPFALYADLATPFCWYGVKPTLFDAPFRFRDSPVTWHAHSILCVASLSRNVRAVAGFQWGFHSTSESVTIFQPHRLSPSDWDQHLSVLAADYPSWSFAPGFHEA